MRGFDPIDAGNARIEGLYFDQIDRLPIRLLDNSTIRVGISAQQYAFPAPTGLVDYSLAMPNDEAFATLTLSHGTYWGAGLAVEAELPVIEDTLGVSAAYGVRLREREFGGRDTYHNYALITRFTPLSDTAITAFFAKVENSGVDARPTLFVSGDALPPQIKRGVNLGQPWAEGPDDDTVYGLIAKTSLAGFGMEMGLFRNRRPRGTTYSDLMAGVTPDGIVARRTIIADRGSVDASTSGELRLVRAFATMGIANRVTASVRARNKTRLFGGSDRIDLGASTVLARDVRTEPILQFGAKNEDDVRQITYGVAYSGILGRWGSLDLGLSRTDYEQQVRFADSAVGVVTTKDTPLLWNVSGSVNIVAELLVYGGLSRGLEEANISPDRAINRAESPPALRTRQEELGLRWKLNESITVVGGVYQITKPYYNLDPDLRYRLLGVIAISGLEISFAGSVAPGITLIAGTIFSDPKISGEAVDLGLVGARPVGKTRRRSSANLDWRLADGSSPWSFDLAVSSDASQVVNASNTLSAPGAFAIDLGTRYRFEALGLNMLIRARAQNLFNDYSWRVTGSGGLSYTTPRNVRIELITDF